MKDGAGNVLYSGHYKDKSVDKVLDANKCKICLGSGHIEKTVFKNGKESLAEFVCITCEQTGYTGDFEVVWQDKERKDNVYEFINY